MICSSGENFRRRRMTPRPGAEEWRTAILSRPSPTPIPEPGPGSRFLRREIICCSPLEHVASIQIPPPQRLRDLLWTPAAVRTTPSFKGTELGEVLIPVLAPFSWRHPDEAVRLGRVTVWEKPEVTNIKFRLAKKCGWWTKKRSHFLNCARSSSTQLPWPPDLSCLFPTIC